MFSFLTTDDIHLNQIDAEDPEVSSCCAFIKFCHFLITEYFSSHSLSLQCLPYSRFLALFFLCIAFCDAVLCISVAHVDVWCLDVCLAGCLSHLCIVSK